MSDNRIQLKKPNIEVSLGFLEPMPALTSDSLLHNNWSIQRESKTFKEGLMTRAILQNNGEVPLRIRSIQWKTLPAKGYRPPLTFPSELQPQLYSPECLRSEDFSVGSTRGNAFHQPLLNTKTLLADSEDETFPGFFIGANNGNCGFLCVAASAERFHPRFKLHGQTGQDEWAFDIEEVPCGNDHLELQPGEKLFGEWLYFLISDTNEPQKALMPYYEILSDTGYCERIKDHNPLPQQRIWCSWNYDFFNDITEADYFGQIELLDRHYTNVKFMQLDDGYQIDYPGGQRAMIDFLYGEPENTFNPEKFSIGPKELADRTRAAGYRPAIWLGLWAAASSPMITEHPEWILLDENGHEVEFEFSSYQTLKILDPSVPEVREYIGKVCRIVFQEWGYEGVKLDFWSFAFEKKNLRYRYPGKTSAQWRDWLVSTFRKYLPVDGFFGFCVVAGTGNPVIHKGGDYFRCTEDIDHGWWSRVVEIAAWTANTRMIMPENTVIANIDSIGWSDRFSLQEWKTWLDICAVSGACIELSGDLRKLPDEKHKLLSETLQLCDLRARIYLPDLSTATRLAPPPLWISESEKHFLVGFFNWHENEKRIAPLAKLASADTSFSKLDWSPARCGEDFNKEEHMLPPKGSLLLKANKKE